MPYRGLLVLLFSVSSGCAAAVRAPQLPLRILNSEMATCPSPERSEPDASAVKARGARTPRIGAPGGSGAGSRRVVPVQSGNETVGGLPAGFGGVAGAAGRG